MEGIDNRLAANLRNVDVVNKIIKEAIENAKGVQESGRAMFTRETVAKVQKTEEDMER